ncbi:MAG: hypothetical protein J0H40_23065 [Rhizobiales bacterium]|nr:hypothetical protein [Hyphomicrobiales bacterium]
MLESAVEPQYDRWSFAEISATVLLGMAIVVVLTIEVASDQLGVLHPHKLLFSSPWLFSALLGAALAHLLKADENEERIAILILSGVIVAVFVVLKNIGLQLPFPSRLSLVSYSAAIASCAIFVLMIGQKKRTLTQTIKMAAPVWLCVISILASDTAIAATSSLATYDKDL